MPSALGKRGGENGRSAAFIAGLEVSTQLAAELPGGCLLDNGMFKLPRILEADARGRGRLLTLREREAIS